MTLILKDVVKDYGRCKKHKVLNDCNLIVEEGKVCSIIGVNGVGKTTLIKCILGLIKVNSGRITFDNNCVEKIKEEGKVGYLPEYIAFNKNISLNSYLRDIAVIKGVDKGEIDHKINDLVRYFGLYEYRNKSIDKFSKGMKRRVGFIQAILNSPKLLILDEPTDGLDPYSRRKMLNYIKEMSKKGTTILLTSHILADLEIVSDKVVIMQEGKILKEIQRDVFKKGEMELEIFSRNGTKKKLKEKVIDDTVSFKFEKGNDIEKIDLTIKYTNLEELYFQTIKEMRNK